MLKRIYLDHAATTPVHPEVIEVISKTLSDHFGNASSTYQRGRDSRNILDQSRQVLAESIHAKPNEIIITSGGSESNNMAIIKTAEMMVKQGKHIITSQVEHQSVLKPMQYLESIGFEVTYLPVNKEGTIELDIFKEALREDTILVSIMLGNNEVGSLLPIKEIGEILENYQAILHTDAVQVYGKKTIDVTDLNIDLLSVSAHKINGPKGIGFLYKNEAAHLPSLILGGEQESKHRAGTENIPYIAGFAKASELRMNQLEDYQTHLSMVKDTFLSKLDNYKIEYEVNGSLNQSLPHILNIQFRGVFSEKLLIQLDLSGIEAASGSACTAGSLQPSHVLTAIHGEDDKAISESVRFSFGFDTTKDDIEQTVEKLAKAIERLKSDD